MLRTVLVEINMILMDGFQCDKLNRQCKVINCLSYKSIIMTSISNKVLYLVLSQSCMLQPENKLLSRVLLHNKNKTSGKEGSDRNALWNFILFSVNW